MRSIHITGISVVMFLGLVPLAFEASAAGDPEAGRKLYVESCLHCHGAQGDGKGDMAAYLTPPPADLTSKKTRTKPDTELRGIITKGRAGTAMTGFVNYDDDQIAHLLADIRSLKP